MKISKASVKVKSCLSKDLLEFFQRISRDMDTGTLDNIVYLDFHKALTTN